MKIALVTRDYNSRGGVEKISQYYARILRDLGHEIHVWCSELAPTPQDNDIKFHQIPLRCGRGALYIWMFATSVRKKLPVSDYDAVLIMGVAGLCEGSFIVANSVHRHWFQYSLQQLSPLSGKFWLKVFNITHYVVMILEWLQYRKSNPRRIIAVSEPIRRELNACYDLPLDLIDVLPNGADTKLLSPDLLARKEFRAELGVADNEYLLCMLSNEIERKGVRQVMQAISALKHFPLKLLIVGRLDRNVCLAIAGQYGIEDRVILHGSTPDVKPYLWASDLYVLPTQYEAWNLSIMEAHSAGLATITTRLGQADLVIDQGHSGYLIEDPPRRGRADQQNKPLGSATR